MGEVSTNDKEKFEALFQRHYAELRRSVISIVGSPDVSEDLVQDVFLSVWRLDKEWKSDAHAKAYLLNAVRNRALNHLNKSRLNRFSSRNDLHSNGHTSEVLPDEATREEEFRKAAQRAITRLPERQREVFWLSRRHGLSYAEIAKTLNISASTVETHMVRALDTLREELQDYLE